MIDASGLGALLLVCTLVLWWHNSVQARDRARQAARAFCQRQGWQLLDQTVALNKQWPRRDVDRWHWRRCYRFDYSPNGQDRLPGELWLKGYQVERISAMTLEGRLLIE